MDPGNASYNSEENKRFILHPLAREAEGERASLEVEEDMGEAKRPKSLWRSVSARFRWKEDGIY